MCLGVPGRIVSIDGLVARVDFWGVARDVRLDIVDSPVAPGDYVLNHVGFAIRRIPAEEVGETLALYDRLLAELEREDRAEAEGRRARRDLMAADVRSEISTDVRSEISADVRSEIAADSEIAAADVSDE